jgi:hypothetical protein
MEDWPARPPWNGSLGSNGTRCRTGQAIRIRQAVLRVGRPQYLLEDPDVVIRGTACRTCATGSAADGPTVGS